MSASISGSTRYPRLAAAVGFLFAIGHVARVGAQSVTTATIGGVIRDDVGRAVASADIRVRNRATGVETPGRSRDDGRFTIAGLEVGGPYVVVARHLGYTERTRDSVMLALGQSFYLELRLERQAVALQGVRIESNATSALSIAPGIATLVTDSALHRLPTSDRDIYAFVRLVPQIGTWYGPSAAGTSPRMNLYMLDGTTDQGLNGGVPSGGVFGAKPITIEAISQYQVQLSPYDVRQGNFAGAVINGVTRSGTNELHGSAFYYGRYESLSRNVPFIRDARFQREQSGFSLGGPLVRNRAHFFVAAERQRYAFPSVGPYVGQAADAQSPLPVSADTIARFQQILASKGLDGGTAGSVIATNPLTNAFARIDMSVPHMSSRLVIRENYAAGDSVSFSRPSPPPTANCLTQACFALSSLSRRQRARKSATVAQLYTTLRSGAFNEIFAGYLNTITTIRPTVKAPLVLVRVNGGNATLQSGTYELAQGDRTDNRSVDVTDNLTVPFGRHELTVGGTAQLYWIRRADVRGAYGVWSFATLTALSTDNASSYRVTQNVAGADVTTSGTQLGFYVGDRWEATPRLALTYGLRADAPRLSGRPPHNDTVNALFGRRTEVLPSGQLQWSPRVGFALDARQDRSMVLRGGLGVFTGRPPLFWLGDAFSNYGVARTLNCIGSAPTFVPDYRAPPLACRSGVTLAGQQGAVNLIDPHFKMPQNLRASLGVDRRLPWDVVASFDAMYTRAINELFFVNRNLAEPVGVDRRGRVMYGSLLPNGQSAPIAAESSYKANVIELTNQSRDYSYAVTGELRKSFAGTFEGSAALTHSRVRDVQSQRLVRNPAVDNWRFGRVLAGRQDATNVGISDFDQPYRVIVSFTYRRPSRRWPTDVSVYYIGSSGFPFTYVAGGDQSTGDLNADSTNVNDPIYIPRNASDPSEILLRGADSLRQAAALDRFIDGASCLRRQRGRIMARNSCRTPWVNTTNLSLRQTLPSLASHQLAMELQVFNALNLLNGQWGRVAIPSQVNTVISTVNLLKQVGTAASSPRDPIFVFDPATRRFSSGNVDSYYQIQLSVRYSF